jgi:ligand-binding sensor domain-containing protein/two-component sensor histidine kinase
MRVTEWSGKERVLRGALWLGLLLAVPALALAEQLPIKSYTTADGLARDNINCIVQDSHGFLWFCTAEGLSRFDGYKFTNYSTDQGLPHRVVNALLETRQGSYWVATGGGLCQFDLLAHVRAGEPRFVVYRPGKDERTQFVQTLMEDRAGTIWCGTKGGLYRLNQLDGRWTCSFVNLGLPANIPEAATVYALLEDRRGGLWVGTGNGLHRRWPDGRVERYTTQHGLPFNDVRILREDSAGQLWVGTTLGLCQLVPEPKPGLSVVARVFTAQNGLSHSHISSLLPASNERLWIGTYGGLNELAAEQTGQQLRQFTTAHGLNGNEITALAEDRDGNLWLGTESNGAMKLARNGFNTFLEADGLGNTRIASIFENQAGQLCVVSSQANQLFIHGFDGRRFTAVNPRLPERITKLGWGWYQSAFQDRAGEWWVPTGEGLCRYPKLSQVTQLGHTRPQAIYTARDGLGAGEIFRLYEDSKGDIWIGTIGPGNPETLTKWERSTGRFQRYTQADGLPAFNAPTAFGEDRLGNLWVGFYEGGLARLAAGRFKLLTTADGLPAGMIRGLLLDGRGQLWIATSRGGLARIDDPGAERPHLVTYTTAEGLASNQVSCVTEDTWGRIYVGTGRGLDRLDPTTGQIKHYTVADGLGNSFVNVAFRDRTGALWFGTLKGLSRLIPEPDRPPLPPPILIGGLRIAGHQYQISELGEAEVPRLRFGPNQNQLNIDFFGLGFGMGETLRYQYKLEGSDQGWSVPTDTRSINYASLAPGQYHFMVRAINADGVVSARPATVAFTILPPVWQRWWFLTLAALLTGLTVYAVHRYRVARLIELERVRTRIATDLHDDIGSSLSQISMLSEVIGRRLGQDQRVAEPLAMIADLSRNLVDSLNDIVWAINPYRDRLSDLTQRMRRFASDVFTARNIEFNFRAPDAQPDLKLGADTRREVFLIFKESVNNIVRHSECAAAEVEFMIKDGWLELKLSDNGHGFNPEQVSDGNGLLNMRQRALKMGGVLEVSSHSSQGTTVRLKAPLDRR